MSLWCQHYLSSAHVFNKCLAEGKLKAVNLKVEAFPHKYKTDASHFSVFFSLKAGDATFQAYLMYRMNTIIINVVIKHRLSVWHVKFSTHLWGHGWTCFPSILRTSSVTKVTELYINGGPIRKRGCGHEERKQLSDFHAPRECGSFSRCEQCRTFGGFCVSLGNCNWFIFHSCNQHLFQCIQTMKKSSGLCWFSYKQKERMWSSKGKRDGGKI